MAKVSEKVRALCCLQMLCDLESGCPTIPPKGLRTIAKAYRQGRDDALAMIKEECQKFINGEF